MQSLFLDPPAQVSLFYPFSLDPQKELFQVAPNSFQKWKKAHFHQIQSVLKL
jgi:hypothetical protein